MKPGALLYITLTHKNLIRWIRRSSPIWRNQQVQAFSQSEALTLMEKHGFKVMKIKSCSLAWGLGPVLRPWAGLFKGVLIKEEEKAFSYRLFGPILRPFGNSLLVIATKR
jgi:hypothetical protein